MAQVGNDDCKEIMDLSGLCVIKILFIIYLNILVIKSLYSI